MWYRVDNISGLLTKTCMVCLSQGKSVKRVCEKNDGSFVYTDVWKGVYL